VYARRNAIIGVGGQGSNADGLNPLTSSQTPSDNSHKNSGTTMRPPNTEHRLEDPEQYAHETGEEHGAGDEPQHGHAPWHQAGAVHQVAQDQPVADAHHEAGPEQERPIMERDERLADREERAGVRARCGPWRNVAYAFSSGVA
jgi:hypothetical protein